MRLTRRQLLASAGAGALGVALGACTKTGAGPDEASTSATTEARFLSRPDLHPPLIEVTRTGRLGPGYSFITPAGPMIVDDDGSPVWVHPVALASTNLQVQTYRGEPVLTFWEGRVKNGTGRGEGVIMNARYEEIARVRAKEDLSADLHELLVTARDTAYVTAYRTVEVDLSAVGGPRRGAMFEANVQEIDIATGELLFSWRASDHIALIESHEAYASGHPYDPVHLNSIEELPDGNLLLSARNTWALYKVDRRTGEIIWRLGGKKSDFTLERTARFAWQHDARRHGAHTISLFDDEASPKEASESRGLLLRVDEEHRAVSVEHDYLHGKAPILAGSQGSVQLLSSGEAVVGWGAQPFYTHYGADRAIVLNAEIKRGQSYRAFRFSWSGTPTELPAVATRRILGGTAVHASWNGSTETTSWQVVGGSSPSRLERLASAARDGFETTIYLAHRPEYLAVEALDAKGSVLSRSKTLSL